MQRGLDYATTLHIPFVFSSNGERFVFHHRTGPDEATETNLSLDDFPPPAELWGHYRAWKDLTKEAEQIVLQDYFDDGGGKGPRYYQVNAVNAAIEAIGKSQNRILLVSRLVQVKLTRRSQYFGGCGRPCARNLAGRNVLIDQRMVNDFRPFRGAMAKLSTGARTIERDNRPDDRNKSTTSNRHGLRNLSRALSAITGPESDRRYSASSRASSSICSLSRLVRRRDRLRSGNCRNGIAHKIKDQTEAAYRRRTAIEKRRKLLQAWADFLENDCHVNVIQLAPAS